MGGVVFHRNVAVWRRGFETKSDRGRSSCSDESQTCGHALEGRESEGVERGGLGVRESEGWGGGGRVLTGRGVTFPVDHVTIELERHAPAGV